MLKFIGFLITIWAVLVTINANTVSKYTRHESDYFFKRVKDQYLDTLRIDVSTQEQKVKHLFLIDLSKSILKLPPSVRTSLVDALSDYFVKNNIFTSSNGGPRSLLELAQAEKDLVLLALYKATQLNDSIKFLFITGYPEQSLALDKIDASGSRLRENWEDIVKATSLKTNDESNFGNIYNSLSTDIAKEHEGFDKVIITIMSDFIPDDGIPKTSSALKQLQKKLSLIENQERNNKFQFNFLFIKGKYKNDEYWQKQGQIHKQLLINDLQTIAFTHEFDLTEITNIDTLKTVNWSPIKYDPVLSNIILFGPKSQFRKEYYQNSDLKFSKLSFSKGGHYSFQLPKQFLDTLILTHNGSQYTLTNQQNFVTLDVKDEKDIVEISSRNEFTEFSKIFIANDEIGYREAFVLDQSKRISYLQTKLLLVIPYYVLSLACFLVLYLFFCFLIYSLVQKNQEKSSPHSLMFFVPIPLASCSTFFLAKLLNNYQACDFTLGFFCGNNQLYIFRDFSKLFILTIIFIFLIEIYQYIKTINNSDMPDDNDGGGAGPLLIANNGPDDSGDGGTVPPFVTGNGRWR